MFSCKITVFSSSSSKEAVPTLHLNRIQSKYSGMLAKLHLPEVTPMYNLQQAAQIRSQFWTVFGQYLKPLPSAGGRPVNWLNYKTGIPAVNFRMDVNGERATIAIELKETDAVERQRQFQKLVALQDFLQNLLAESWDWEADFQDEDGTRCSRISKSLEGVSVFSKQDWPAIISFFKQRIIMLDQFWNDVSEML